MSVDTLKESMMEGRQLSGVRGRRIEFSMLISYSRKYHVQMAEGIRGVRSMHISCSGDALLLFVLAKLVCGVL